MQWQANCARCFPLRPGRTRWPEWFTSSPTSSERRSRHFAAAEISHLRAAEWVRRFDSQAEGTQKQFYTYTAQNRRARELVDVLLPMFTNGTNASRSNTTGRNVAPQYQEAGIQSGTGAGFPPMTGASTSGGAAQPASFQANPSPPIMQQNPPGAFDPGGVAPSRHNRSTPGSTV